MDFIQETLRQLRPNDGDWYGWAKVDQGGNKIPNDQRMCWEHAISIKDGVTKPTKEEFDAKLAEVEAEWDAKLIDQLKQSAFQSESDPLFFKWQRGEATEQEWLDKVAEIKARFS